MSLFTGQILHGCRIDGQEMLDGGGGGYRAVRIVDERPVWLRVILPPFYAHLPAFLARFDQAYTRLASLTHPQLVPLVDFWHDDSGAFIITDYMAGGSLWQHLKDKPLPDAETSRILAQITGALDYLHAAGLMHQALQPGAIRLDAAQQAYLDTADAALTLMTNNASTHLVRTYIAVPWYISPEQAQGYRVDYRTDIYSLGITLYELLTGKKPFEAHSPLEAALHHVRDPLPSLRLLRPDLPAAVDAVLQKSTAKKPDARYASAADLLRAWQAAFDE